MEAVGNSDIMPWCLTGGSAGLLKVWDLQKRQMLDLRVHDAGIIKAKFMKMHPTLIASNHVDQAVRIWDSRTGEAR